ncbi:hypothetical protein [Sorangium sp. So ce363]|uniref:hypothetical protein n=1 Tax=Sorangium sp. So ce363 TaxID=3133304 RepID=UPI003F5EAC7F
MALDGVFTRKDGPEVVFHQGPAPSRDDIAAVAARVEKRMMRWLRRRKLVGDGPIEERSNEAPELSPLEHLVPAARGRDRDGDLPIVFSNVDSI